jgi:hypothetical protein
MRLREVNKHCKEIKGGGGSWVKSRWKNCTTKPNNNSKKKQGKSPRQTKNRTPITV